MAEREYNTVDERQSYVQRSGQEWENNVMDFVNEKLKELGSDLVVINGKTVKKGSELWNKLAIPVGKPGSTQKIWGDIDLIVIDKQENPIAVISCKTSLHGRFSETLFYAVVLKDLVEELKVVFATPDKGRQQKKGKWQSEWGSEEKPTKDRLLGSHYLDGVYILNPNTKLGGMIKHLEELPKDLIKWHESMNR
ncbi:MAG: hypothetical protein J7J92_02500 [Candidatus Aenigmarchaeota archaeon]|nr:hypothetical protein [Candidatus Aenigmarchaeota archaeon]